MRCVIVERDGAFEKGGRVHACARCKKRKRKQEHSLGLILKLALFFFTIFVLKGKKKSRPLVDILCSPVYEGSVFAKLTSNLHRLGRAARQLFFFFFLFEAPQLFDPVLACLSPKPNLVVSMTAFCPLPCCV